MHFSLCTIYNQLPNNQMPIGNTSPWSDNGLLQIGYKTLSFPEIILLRIVVTIGLHSFIAVNRQNLDTQRVYNF